MDATNALMKAKTALLKPKGQASALEHLLDAWRGVRHPRLVALIERVEKQVERRPLGQGTLKAMQARWLEIAAGADPLDLPRLLAALTTGRAQATLERLQALEQFPDDPRTALALAKLLAVRPFAAGVHMNQVTALARELLVRIGYSPVLEVLAQHRDAPEVDSLLLDLEKLLRPSRELDPVEAKLCEEIEAELPNERSATALLEAIYAAPDDDAPSPQCVAVPLPPVPAGKVAADAMLTALPLTVNATPSRAFATRA